MNYLTTIRIVLYYTFIHHCIHEVHLFAICFSQAFVKAGKPNDAARWLLQMPQDIASVTRRYRGWNEHE